VGLLKEGVPTKEIARRLHVSVATIVEINKQLGLPKRFKRCALTPEQRAEVAARYKAGENYEELRTAFDVSSPTIRSAVQEHGVRIRRGWSKYRTTKWTDRKGRLFIFKSTWERAYAEHLDARNVDWDYEVRSFSLPKCRCYTPDFFIYEGGELFEVVEVHGWLDQRTKDRITEFVQTYPGTKFRLMGPGELAADGVIPSDWQSHPEAENVSRFRERLAA
jgi:hypothetical protein